jgi:hypothetical protein
MPRYWKVKFTTPQEARAEKKASATRQRLLDAAREFPEGQTKTVILETAKVKSSEASRNVFDALVNVKLLVPCKVQKQGCNRDGYRLSPETLKSYGVPA